MKRGTFKRKDYTQRLQDLAKKRVSYAKIDKTSQTNKKHATGTKFKAIGRIKSISKQKISVIQRNLWNECKRIIRLRYPAVCYTCGSTGLVGSNLHTGHMLAKAAVGAYLKYDLRILRPQCYLCNIRHGGRGADFIENMRQIEGNEYVDAILKDRNVAVKAYDHYVQILEEYKNLHT